LNYDANELDKRKAEVLLSEIEVSLKNLI